MKGKKNENALKTKETDTLDSRFNVSLSNSHCNSPGVTFLLVNRQNFTMYLEIKLLPLSSRVRGLYISGLCIKLSKGEHAFCRINSTYYLINFCINIIYFSVSTYFCFPKDSLDFFRLKFFMLIFILDCIVFKT